MLVYRFLGHVSIFGPLLLFCGPAMAHGGGLDSNGCHNDRKRGGYHCHRSGYTPKYRGNVGPVPFLGNTVPSINRRRPKDNGRPARKPVDTLLVHKTQLVFIAQSLLTELGYNPGKINGVASRETTSAVRKFQSKSLLPVTGSVDAALLVQLARALRRRDRR